MSFVFAEKINKSPIGEVLSVYSDTKIELSNTAGASLSKEQFKAIKKYGMLKSVIICPEFCISFAGNNIALASKLFRSLYECGTFHRRDVINLAFDIHKSAGTLFDIEFIIASCEDGNANIDCIKDGCVYESVSSAWIGSYKAFNEFQKYRLEKDDSNSSNWTDNSFRRVVEGCGDESVGGFCFKVSSYPEMNGFAFDRLSAFISNKTQLIHPGECVKFFVSSVCGGMAYDVIPVSISNVLLDINNIEYSIIYSRDYRFTDMEKQNLNLFGLMLPIEVIPIIQNGYIVGINRVR